MGSSAPPKEDDTAPAESMYEEHLDISIGYWLIDEDLRDRDNDAVLQEIEQRFNITVVPVNMTWDDYNRSLDMWADTGDLPDLFAGDLRTGERFRRLAENGLIHELPEDMSGWPNLARYMDSPETQSCMLDGKLWCIFRQTYSEQAETVKDRTILYRRDLAKKADTFTDPADWDEFRQMMRDIIREDPEGKGIQGITSKSAGFLLGLILNYSVPLGSTGGKIFYWVRNRDGKLVPALFAGESFGSDALPSWRLAREMYDEGTISEDLFFTSVAQAQEGFLNGTRAAICIDGGIANSRTYEDLIAKWRTVHGTDFFEDVGILGLMPDVNGKKRYPVWDYAWSESYVSSRVSDEKLMRILDLYDFLLSEEGMRLARCGIEGVTWERTDDGAVKLMGDEPVTSVYPSSELFSYLVCWNVGILDPSGFPTSLPQRCIDEDECRVEEARQCEIPEYDYDATMRLAQSDRDFVIDINRIFQEILLDEEPVEICWQQIIDEYEENGLTDLIQWMNE